jgi:hypothetical protein
MRSRAWVLGLAAVLLAACGGSRSDAPPARTDASSAGDSGYASESERTRQMEADAEAARRRLEEARASGATGEDAVRAYEEFERERARINETAEGSAEEAPAEDASAEEPPPE